MEVLTHTTFEDIELCTMTTILDQDYLNIDSELDLFLALGRYAEKHGYAIESCKCVAFTRFRNALNMMNFHSILSFFEKFSKFNTQNIKTQQNLPLYFVVCSRRGGRND